MATRKMALCFALSALAATATAQTVPSSETWSPISHTARTITGRVTFTPTEITFQNGKSLPLARGGQMLFRPEAKKKKVMADLYKVTSQGDPVLQNGNTLCKGNPIACLIVWKSEKAGKEADPRYFGAFLRAETQRRFGRRLRTLHLRRRSTLRIASGVAFGGWNQSLGFPSRGFLSEDRGQRQSSGSTDGGAPSNWLSITSTVAILGVAPGGFVSSAEPAMMMAKAASPARAFIVTPLPVVGIERLSRGPRSLYEALHTPSTAQRGALRSDLPTGSAGGPVVFGRRHPK